MTSFWKFFKELFKQKNRTAYLIFLIQLAAAVVITVISIITGNLVVTNNDTLAGVRINTFTTIILGITFSFGGFSAIAQPIYLLITSWKNEKINRSQTWRLAAISDNKFYLANLLSSFASYIYLAVMQLIVVLLACGITYISSNNVQKGVAKIFYEMGRSHVEFDWGPGLRFLLELVILIILAGLAWYITISFYHFAYRSVMDFLPIKNKLVLFLVRLITLIVVIYLISQVVNVIINGLVTLIAWDSNDFSNSLGGAIIDFLIFNMIFGGLNMWLINSFVEAKEN